MTSFPEKRGNRLVNLKDSNPVLSYNYLKRALPKFFNFYELGSVCKSKITKTTLSWDSINCVGFSINGDLQGVLAVFFSENLDESTYTELGNTIASYFVSKINKDMEVILSPPKKLGSSQINDLIKSNSIKIYEEYSHNYSNHNIPVKVFLSIMQKPGRAHA